MDAATVVRTRGEAHVSLVPPVARMRLLILFAAAAASAGGILVGWGNPVTYAVPVLAVVVVITELAVVNLSFGKQRWAFSLTEAAIAASFVRSPRAWIVLAVAAGVFCVEVLRRHDPMRVAFAMTQYGAATALGAEFAQGVGAEVSGAIGGMAVFWFVKNGLGVAAEVFETGKPVGSLIWERTPFAALHSVGAAGIGILGAWIAVNQPGGVVALVVPVVLLWISYDEQATRSAETALFAELARLQERASNRSVDVSAYVVLTAACRVFNSPDVEMVLLAEEGPIHFAADAIGIDRHRVDPAALDEDWVLKALAGGGTVTGVENGRPWCATVLGSGDSPLAVLVARRAVSQAQFGRRDVLLAGVLAEQAETWLTSAARAVPRDDALLPRVSSETAGELQGFGPDTEPALRVLRDSANRLARLASNDAPPEMDDIVDELHTAERAVASLLGAMALASDPELVLGLSEEDLQLTGPRRSLDDWTTTGVLPS
ncbi:MAG TPA: hypothetical protein VHE57_01990 [Mycobacteriales bacterium]|nr:hypothetical protein [Mycobacteriales bacterium]